MKLRLAISLFAFALALASIPSLALAEHQQVLTVRLHAETEVMDKPGAVWSYLTTGRNLVTWCPQWKGKKNALVSITHVGDVLDYTDEWGNGGRSVVTYLDKGKELRVAHEPENGSYMCQAKLVLTPTANGTRVQLWDQYTDESSPTDVAATTEKMEKELAETVAAIKTGCESRRKFPVGLKVTK